MSDPALRPLDARLDAGPAARPGVSRLVADITVLSGPLADAIARSEASS